MGWVRILTVLFLLAFPLQTYSAEGKISKVLVHLLDQKGRHALSPSLFDRDAYQAWLRRHPEACHGVQFEIHWKAKKVHGPLQIRIELVTTEHPKMHPLVLTKTVQPPKLFGRWTRIRLFGDAYKKAGKVLAWRVTLREGDTVLAEQKSFLW